ncbi:MAG: PorV/PorQ family protein [Candidatus Zhuqueibacterota bacterium]
MRKIGLIINGLLFLCFDLFGQSSLTKTGTTVANYLNIDVGSRAVAMGGSFVSIANDASAMYWNPAGIARIKDNSALFCHTKWIADIDINFVGVTVPIAGFGTIGAQAKFIIMDRMERTTVDFPDGNGEFFDAGSYVMGLSYARDLTDRFSIGGSFKYINERIYNSSASAIAFDVGTLFTTQFNGLQLGMSISNYGGKMRMDGKDLLIQTRIDDRYSGTSENTNALLKTEAYDLPIMFRIGISMDVLKGIGKSNLLLSMDALHPNNSNESLNLGLEYVFNKMFALRAGYNSLFNEEINTGLSVGVGFHYALIGTELQIDYGYQNFNELIEAQMFTLSIGF